MCKNVLLAEFQSKVRTSLGGQEGEAQVAPQPGEVCGECRHQRGPQCEYNPTARRELMMTIFKAMSFVQNCKVNMITMILIRILINCTLKIQNSNGAAAVNYFIFKLIFHEYK